MPLAHVAFGLFACLLWSGNFVAVKIGLDAGMTPFLLTALRFALACGLLPLARRPAGISWPALSAIGLLIGVGQFGLATLAVAAGLSAACVALILQTQVLLTMGLAACCLDEKLTSRTLAGCLVALLGVGVFVLAGRSGATAFSLIGLLLALAAAGAAALSNIVIKRFGGAGNALRLAVWISPFPVVPLLILSSLTEGSPFVILAHADPAITAGVLLYGGIISAVGGTAIWAWLLRRHAASHVALLTPAIPIFAFALSAILFDQHLQLWQSAAAGLVLCGVLTASVPSPLARKKPDRVVPV